MYNLIVISKIYLSTYLEIVIYMIKHPPKRLDFEF